MLCAELQVALTLRKEGKEFYPDRNKTLRGIVNFAIPACGKAVQIDAKFVD